MTRYARLDAGSRRRLEPQRQSFRDQAGVGVIVDLARASVAQRRASRSTSCTGRFDADRKGRRQHAVSASARSAARRARRQVVRHGGNHQERARRRAAARDATPTGTPASSAPSDSHGQHRRARRTAVRAGMTRIVHCGTMTSAAVRYAARRPTRSLRSAAHCGAAFEQRVRRQRNAMAQRRQAMRLTSSGVT